MLLFCKKQNSLDLRAKIILCLDLDGITLNEWTHIKTCYASPCGRGMRIKAFSEAKTLNSMVRAPIRKRIPFLEAKNLNSMVRAPI
ncbi:hypothetical protein UABAM_06038 [Candidatus Uabimicrobium amorphum]|uniref:Uncharacterized protein n=1 Tax=Uabimicrobium amorphum TaxID=2596890 RepID=A0A5S9IU18_UABAM|nr:hypothetical protein UABAM_06038 [Candidatus Uabimicrobium amorphum]